VARPLRKNQNKNARDHIVSNAQQLVLTQGYTSTSIDSINSQAGFSKGTFYHFFKSKSELLDAVVSELTAEGAKSTQRAIDETGGGALDRFNRFLDAARRWRLVGLPETAATMRAVFTPENSLLRERMRDQSIALAAPALTRLLEDGVAEGVFSIDDPPATARVFLLLAYAVSDDMVREVISSSLPEHELLASIVPRGEAFMRSTEALLGIEADSLGGPDEKLLAGMVKAFRTES
jgi:AcrR family transcriptional regulator